MTRERTHFTKYSKKTKKTIQTNPTIESDRKQEIHNIIRTKIKTETPIMTTNKLTTAVMENHFQRSTFHFFNTVTERTTEVMENTNSNFTSMSTKREIYFKIIDDKIEPGNKNIYHNNFNSITKAYIKCKCEMSKNGYDQKVENLKN